MKISQKVFLTLFILISLHQSSWSQTESRNGYVIVSGSDTLSGEILRHSISNGNLTIKVNGLKKEFKSFEITGFGYYKGKHYTSNLIKGEFLEIILSGEFSLFKHKSSFIIQDEKDVLHTFKQSGVDDLGIGQWKRQLSTLVTPMNISPEEVLNMHFNEKDFVVITSKLNQFFNSESLIYKSNIPPTKITTGLYFGVTRKELSIQDLENVDELKDQKTESNGLSIGVSTDFSFPRTSERIGLNIQLLYSESNFSYSNSKEPTLSSPLFIQYNTLHTLRTLSVPVAARYTPINGRLKFSIMPGLSLNYYLDLKSTLLTDRISGTTITTTEDPYQPWIKRYFNPWVRFSLSTSFDKIGVSINADIYSSTKNQVRGQGVVSKLNQSSIGIIISYLK